MNAFAYFAKMLISAIPATPFMEVTVVKTRKILSAIGTFVIVGAVSTAGAALWTNVQEISDGQDETDTSEVGQNYICGLPKSREEPLIRRLSFFRTNGTAYYGEQNQEVDIMNKQKWTEKPITWGGYLKLCGVVYVISVIAGFVWCIASFEPAWWSSFKKKAKKLFMIWHPGRRF